MKYYLWKKWYSLAAPSETCLWELGTRVPNFFRPTTFAYIFHVVPFNEDAAPLDVYAEQKYMEGENITSVQIPSSIHPHSPPSRSSTLTATKIREPSRGTRSQTAGFQHLHSLSTTRWFRIAAWLTIRLQHRRSHILSLRHPASQSPLCEHTSKCSAPECSRPF